MPHSLKLAGYAFVALKTAVRGCTSILKQCFHLPTMMRTNHHSQLSNTCPFFASRFSDRKSQTQPVVVSASESLEILSPCGNIHHLRTKTYKAGCPKRCKPEFFKWILRCQSLAYFWVPRNIYFGSGNNSTIYLLPVQVKLPNFTNCYFPDGTSAETTFDCSIFHGANYFWMTRYM